MISSFILMLFTLLGAVIFLLGPETFWILGVGIILLTWLMALIVFIPRRAAEVRGQWTLLACFFLLASIIASATLIYVHTNEIPIELTSPSLSTIAFTGERIVAAVSGVAVGFIATLIFFVIVCYFCTIYALELNDELNFWNAFKSFVHLILNFHLPWLLIEDGEITELVKKGFPIDRLSLGKVVIKPGNAVVMEKGGKITRICGPGIIVTTKNEKPRQVFDLRLQFAVLDVENVITADRIPLEIELGVGYKLTPASDLDDPTVIKEKNFNLFPVTEETLRKAAFNGTAGGWTGFSQGAPTSLLRDQIMAHRFDEILEVQSADQDISIRVNERRIKHIEDMIKETLDGFADTNMGVTITGIDIREITLPNDVKGALHTRIKAQAEAEAIQRIETERNAARSDMVSKILESISTGTGGPIGAVELKLATVFAQISRRALTDDVLGHQYIDMLRTIAEGDATKIFNVTPHPPTIQPEHVPLINAQNSNGQ